MDKAREPSRRPGKGRPLRARAPRKRLGGRSARVRAAVLEKAYEVLTERGLHGFTIAEVAARSGVHETTIYRRWPSIAALALDACLEGISTAIPAPDCGSLAADLVALTRGIIAVLDGPKGRALLDICRIADPAVAQSRAAFLSARFAAAGPIFQRARERGEWRDTLDEALLLELLIAPIYFRALVTQEPLATWPVERITRLLLAAAGAPVGRRTV